MRKPALEARLKNLVNCLFSYRYALKRNGVDPDGIEKALVDAVVASGADDLMKNKERKIKRGIEAVKKHRRGKD